MTDPEVDEVMRRIAVVPLGFAVTFPDGMVVDRRPLPAPLSAPLLSGWSTALPAPPIGNQGYRCGCGRWVQSGESHTCVIVGPSYAGHTGTTTS